MTACGFGILKNGKPYGVWPLSFEKCSAIVRLRKKEAYDTDSFQVVPVSYGSPVPLLMAPTFTPKEAS